MTRLQLMTQFNLSERQSQAILDMRLRRLTGLEREKIESEYQELINLITDLKDILAKPERINQIIREELDEIRRKFGEPRRTELLVGEVLSLEDEDLINEEDVVITLSSNGYIKRMAANEFRAQKRGGRGVQGMGVNDDDFVKNLVSTNTHDTLLFFTNTGKVLKAKAYEIPEYGRTAKGIPIVNLLGIDSSESIQTVINVSGHPDRNQYLFFVTKKGLVKRVEAGLFANIRQSGLKAINLNESDELINVMLTNGEQDIIIGTHDGYSVRFEESSIRAMGRGAAGVRGIRLRDDDFVVGSSTVNENQEVLVITENGFGKRTVASEYPTKGRGGKGIKALNRTERTGALIGLVVVDGNEDVILITDTGVIIRFKTSDISQTGRATQGVHVMRMQDDAKVMTIALAEPEEDEEASELLGNIDLAADDSEQNHIEPETD